LPKTHGIRSFAFRKKLRPDPRPRAALLVWRLDRWGRSLLDLVTTLQELTDLNIGFVSLSEALDLTTSTGRTMAGMLSVFAAFEHDILRDRVRAGLDHARQSGKVAHISADPPQRPSNPPKSGNCSARESVNLKSRGGWISAELPFAEY
jgi:DNA invertase Pin-like site-specific DNA recombinase